MSRPRLSLVPLYRKHARIAELQRAQLVTHRESPSDRIHRIAATKQQRMDR